MHCLYGIPPGGSGTSRHCSSSGQSGSFTHATDAAIQPPAITIAARPTTTVTKPAVTIPELDWGVSFCSSPVDHIPLPPTTATAPTPASRRGPECNPVQLPTSSATATTTQDKDRETVRGARSSISSTDPRLC